MEIVLSYDYNKNREGWYKSLISFNSINANNSTFVDRYGLENKKLFMETLLQILKQTLKEHTKSINEDRKIILEAFKLCFREETGLEFLKEEENIILFIKLANLESDDNYDESVSAEALKCIVNIVVKFKSTITKLEPQKIVDLLKHSIYNKPNVFPLCRIIFQMGLEREIATSLISLSTVKHLINLLEESVNNQDIPITNELLRCIFTLTMRLGPLESGNPSNPTEQQREDVERLIPIFHKIYLWSNNGPLFQCKIFALNCIINIPIEYISRLTNPEMIQSFMSILNYQLNDVNSDPTDSLTPILMVLTSFVHNLKEVRLSIKSQVFPPPESIDKVSMEGPSESDSISSKLKKHLSASNIALKHYVQEFLFILCDEDGTDFI
jgi:hypothetical protein